jgi:hypothetical protein
MVKQACQRVLQVWVSYEPLAALLTLTVYSADFVDSEASLAKFVAACTKVENAVSTTYQ